jgi:hypothetical protein
MFIFPKNSGREVATVSPPNTPAASMSLCVRAEVPAIRAGYGCFLFGIAIYSTYFKPSK